MARHDQSWEELGQNIQQIIDKAVSQKDFQRLNQTINQTIDRAVDASSEAVRRVMEITAEKGKKTERKTVSEVPETKPAKPVLYAKTGGRTAGGILKIVGGSLLALIGFGVTLSGVLLEFLLGGGNLMLIPLTASVLTMGGGTCLLGSGIHRLKYLERFRIYCKTLGNKTHCTLKLLAQSVGKSEKFTNRELRKMIGEGLFLEGHFDNEQTRLITSHETFQEFEQSRKLLEQHQQQMEKAAVQEPSQKSQVQEILDKGNTFLQEIRRCNDAIPCAEISRKIYRIELIVERIFERASVHPEIIPDLKKMMDYYLPMTVKLLDAYADMDAQPVQGPNIQSSKQEIEATLDTLNRAFEKLLDSVFADAALDISSDISVLTTLLAQDGLTENDFTM